MELTGQKNFPVVSDQLMLSDRELTKVFNL